MAIDIIENPDKWITAWQEYLNESEEYSEAGEGWGVDFEGSFVFETEPDQGLEEPMYFYVDPYDGEIREARVIDSPEEVEYGFLLSGPYSNWKKLINGEIGAIDGLMSGAFSLDGDMQKVTQYSHSASIMTEASAAIDTEFQY